MADTSVNIVIKTSGQQKLERLTAGTRKLEDSVKRLRSPLERSENGIRKFGNSAKTAGDKARSASGGFGKLGGVVGKLAGAFDDFRRGGREDREGGEPHDLQARVRKIHFGLGQWGGNKVGQHFKVDPASRPSFSIIFPFFHIKTTTRAQLSASHRSLSSPSRSLPFCLSETSPRARGSPSLTHRRLLKVPPTLLSTLPTLFRPLSAS